MGKKPWKSKKQRQAWWRSLSPAEQEAKLDFWQREKAKRARSSTFDHRTQFPFRATVKRASGRSYRIVVDRVDGEVATRQVRGGPGLLWPRP